VVLLYLAVGITTILVLRGMSRRFRTARAFTDDDTPYGTSARLVGPDQEEALR
jgi:cytochrome d ubiquinol oxidase subunit I